MQSKNRNYDLIVIDLDGTLLDNDKYFSPGALEAIQEAQDTGIRIVIATGRNLTTLNNIFKELRYKDYFIGSGGAYIANPSSGEILFMKTIPMKDLREIILLSRKYPSILFVEHPDWMMAEKLTERHRQIQKTHGYRWTIVDDLLTSIKEEPTKAMLLGLPDNLANIKRHLEDGGYHLHMLPASADVLEITTAGITKGTALLKLLAHIQVKSDRVAVIGDHYNDLDMFHQVKTAVAMGNAPEEIKKAADLVSPPNDEGGAAWAIRELMKGGAAFKKCNPSN